MPPYQQLPQQHHGNHVVHGAGKSSKGKSIVYFDKSNFKCYACFLILIIALILLSFLQPDNGILNQVRVYGKNRLSSTPQCTFVVLCGTGDVDTVEEMRPLLASAILLTSCPLHFILVADANSSRRAQQFFEDNLNYSSKLVSVEIWTISPKFIESWANSFRFDVLDKAENKRVWMIAKLFVPWLLPDLDRVVVIDSDMVFLEDPAILWAEFDGDDSWAYKLPLNDMENYNSICSCIVLINIRTVLKNDFYPSKFLHALALAGTKPDPETGLYETERVDQHVYYYLYKAYPKLLRTLKQEFNMDYCHQFYGAFVNNSTVKASLLHMNCGSWDFPERNSSAVFFKFYEQFKWAWFRPQDGNGHKVSIQTYVHDAGHFHIVALNNASF